MPGLSSTTCDCGLPLQDNFHEVPCMSFLQILKAGNLYISGRGTHHSSLAPYVCFHTLVLGCILSRLDTI